MSKGSNNCHCEPKRLTADNSNIFAARNPPLQHSWLSRKEVLIFFFVSKFVTLLMLSLIWARLNKLIMSTPLTQNAFSSQELKFGANFLASFSHLIIRWGNYIAFLTCRSWFRVFIRWERISPTDGFVESCRSICWSVKTASLLMMWKFIIIIIMDS